jgi:NAD(P)H-dependent FMN reductase
MDKLKILIILGTDRENSYSSQVLEIVKKEVKKRADLEFDTADIRKLNFSYNKKDSTFSKQTEESDGFIIVTPEYNHGYPGTLKTLLDTEYGNYQNKAVGIIGVSNGAFGGARMIESLISVLKAVGLKSTKRDAHFCKVDKAIEKGELDNSIEEINGLLDEFVWLTRSLKYGRENF